MALDNDDIKQLIAILQRGLTDDGDNPKPKKITKPKGKTKPQQKNKFDSMSEKNLHKDDVAIDKKLSVMPPTARARNFKPVKVQCRVCGKVDNIDPALIEAIERYKCNKCSTTAG